MQTSWAPTAPDSNLDRGTFGPNVDLPVHRWFRFPAGFSATWAQNIIANEAQDRPNCVFFDPFAGSGTSVIAAQQQGVVAVGLEGQPFIARIARTKLLWSTPVQPFEALAMDVLQRSQALDPQLDDVPELLRRCFDPEPLVHLEALRTALNEVPKSDSSELVWLALAASLRPSASAGTAPWQYVLPMKRKAKTQLPRDAFLKQVHRMAMDMRGMQRGPSEPARIIDGDARDCAQVASDSVDLVFTSPPYANNYDYADATRLEMTFFREIRSWGDLGPIRAHLVRSSSQHAASDRLVLSSLLSELETSRIAVSVARACSTLEETRLSHGGRKPYHLMVAAYFADMARCWRALRRVCRDGAVVYIVIGDSAPYGVHIPVEDWLGQLALDAGFRGWQFTKIRNRNVKWKNRKHRVPLQEGVLKVAG